MAASGAPWRRRDLRGLVITGAAVVRLGHGGRLSLTVQRRAARHDPEGSVPRCPKKPVDVAPWLRALLRPNAVDQDRAGSAEQYVGRRSGVVPSPGAGMVRPRARSRGAIGVRGFAPSRPESVRFGGKCDAWRRSRHERRCAELPVRWDRSTGWLGARPATWTGTGARHLPSRGACAFDAASRRGSGRRGLPKSPPSEVLVQESVLFDHVGDGPGLPAVEAAVDGCQEAVKGLESRNGLGDRSGRARVRNSIERFAVERPVNTRLRSKRSLCRTLRRAARAPYQAGCRGFDPDHPLQFLSVARRLESPSCRRSGAALRVDRSPVQRDVRRPPLARGQTGGQSSRMGHAPAEQRATRGVSARGQRSDAPAQKVLARYSTFAYSLVDVEEHGHAPRGRVRADHGPRAGPAGRLPG